MLVGCAARRHMPAPCNGLKKSTKPAGMPRTTSELKPSSGIKSANGSSSDSSRQTYKSNRLIKISMKNLILKWLILTSRSSPRVSSSATDSAIRIAVSIKFLGIFSCDNNAAICSEFRRKHEQASFWTSSSLVLAACEHCIHWFVLSELSKSYCIELFRKLPVENRHTGLF